MNKILLLISLSLMSCIDVFPSESEDTDSAKKNCGEEINITDNEAFSKLVSDLLIMAEIDELFIDVTYRDFSPHHPDFESFEHYNPNTSCERMGGTTSVNSPVDVTPGMVEDELFRVDEFDPSTWIPKKTDGRCASNNLDKWFVDYPGDDKEKHNFTIEGSIVLKRKSVDSRVFRFERKYSETSDSSGGFYPLDLYAGSQKSGEENYGKENGSSWCGSDVTREVCIQRSLDEQRGTDGNALQNSKYSTELGVAKGRRHNYNFTTEGFVQFDYLGNDDEVFLFEGDDDIWVFIDGHLVVDMGGVHQPKKAEIRLTEIAERAYNEGWNESWRPGSVHTLKFFHAERQTDGSNFVMELTLNEIRPSVSIGPQITYAAFESGSNQGSIWLQVDLDDKTIDKINNGDLSEATLSLATRDLKGASPDRGEIKVLSIKAGTTTAEERNNGARGIKYDVTYDISKSEYLFPISGNYIALYFNEDPSQTGIVNPTGDHITSTKGEKVDGWNYVFSEIVLGDESELNNGECE